MNKNLVPYNKTISNISIFNSRFITTAIPCFSAENAKEFFKLQKKKYSDANHNVPLFIIGHGNTTTMHATDDGEPSGTAGKPALAVLKGSGIGDIAVTITRYFGGRKLGTGGLVKAYSDSIRELLKKMILAEKASVATVQINLDYTHFEKLKYLIGNQGGKIIKEDFTEIVQLKIDFLSRDLENFNTALQQGFQSKISFQTIKIEPNAIFPIKNQGIK